MARAMLAAVFFIIIMSVGASAIAFQGDQLGHNYDIDGEEIDAPGSSFSGDTTHETENADVADSKYYEDESIHVYDENGIEMVEGQDYEWNENNGTVFIPSGSGLTDDAFLTIDYGFHVTSDQQQEVLSVVGAQVGIGQALMYVFGAILAIAILRLLVGAG